MRKLVKRVLPDRTQRQLVRRFDRSSKAQHRRRNEAACPLPGGKLTRGPGGSLPHWCMPLEDPTWVPADGNRYVEDDDAILGFEIDGQPYAVSWDVMASHHVANLHLGGRSYVLTLCDACIGGGLFDAEVDGTRLRFRFDGVYGGTPYVVDHPTGSLWTMVTMRPLHGSALRHGPLRRFPMVHATWAEWVHFHPDTLVVDEPGEPDDGHGADVRWPGHDVVPDFNADRLTPVDDRLSPIDVVLGIEVEGAARTYPLDVLHPHGGIANDVVAGQPVVAVGVPGTYLAVAFHREVAGRTLTFAWERGAVTADDHDPRMVDQETGSLWDLFGNAVDGPLKGEHLPFAWGGLQKWFNWSNLSPGSTIWAPDPHPA